MSRFEEIVNEAIDEVVLGESLQRRGARRPDRRAGPRAPGRAARRGRGSPPAIRRPSPTPASGPRDPGDLHPVRHRGRLRARHPHADRRRGPGDDRLPLRPGAGRRPRPRAPRRRRLQRRRDRARSSTRVPVATHNQRGIGTLHIGRPEGVDAEIDAPRPAAHRRGVDELGDLRADEALRRGRRGREGAHATRASSRTASAR